MKKILLSLFVLIALIACSPTKKSTSQDVEHEATQQTTDNTSTSEGEDPSEVILGTWTGELNGKELTIVVEKINGTELAGYNILGSNRRNLTGTFTDGAWDQPCTKAYVASLQEPGDAQGDGVFTVKFVGYEDEEETEDGPACKGNLKGVEAHGEWKSNNSTMKQDIYLIKQK